MVAPTVVGDRTGFITPTGLEVATGGVVLPPIGGAPNAFPVGTVVALGNVGAIEEAAIDVDGAQFGAPAILGAVVLGNGALYGATVEFILEFVPVETRGEKFGS